MRISKSNRQRLKRQKEFLHTLLFFGITTMSIAGLLVYLWIYTEIDETLIGIEVQNATITELNNSINELNGEIARLARVDRISSIARQRLDMVVAHPETVVVYINSSEILDAND
jgi:cell division protein FtsL